MFFRRVLIGAGIVLICLALLYPAAAAQSDLVNQYSSMERISASEEGTGGGSGGAICANGQMVVFEATASDLMPDTIDDSRDVFIRDRQTGTFERISVNSAEELTYNPGEYTSYPAISANCGFVAFSSMADNLAIQDQNGMPDIFVRERANDHTSMTSRALDNYAANGPSFNPAISATSHYVVFQSFANNLTDNDHNDSIDIYLRDRKTRVTELISITDEGQQGEDSHLYGFSSVDVSDDGRYVVFSYQRLPIPGTPMHDGPFVYVRDRVENTLRMVAEGSYPSLSADGRYIAFVSMDALATDDRNFSHDVYLYDQQAEEFERISLTDNEAEVLDQWIGSTPSVSADGRYVVFQSSSDALVLNDSNEMSDIFLRDRVLNRTVLVSGGVTGGSGNGDSFNPAISDEATVVTFNSWASDLVQNDTNDRPDVFAINLVNLGILPGQFVVQRLYLPLSGK